MRLISSIATSRLRASRGIEPLTPLQGGAYPTRSCGLPASRESLGVARNRVLVERGLGCHAFCRSRSLRMAYFLRTSRGSVHVQPTTKMIHDITLRLDSTSGEAPPYTPCLATFQVIFTHAPLTRSESLPST